VALSNWTTWHFVSFGVFVDIRLTNGPMVIFLQSEET